MQFDYAVRALRGRRDEQQDAVAVRVGAGGAWHDMASEGRCARVRIALSDGMGGRQGGAVASRVATHVAMATWGGGQVDDVRMRRSVDAANAAVGRAAASRPELAEMGATLLMVEASLEGASWVSVGDTHLYLLRSGQLLPLNADHSGKPLREMLAAAGRLDADGPEDHILYAALTGGETGPIDASRWPLPLEPGDVLVAATDGVDTLTHGQLTAACLDGTRDPDGMAERIMGAVEAVDDLAQDNTTVCVVRVVSESALVQENSGCGPDGMRQRSTPAGPRPSSGSVHASAVPPQAGDAHPVCAD
jgi:serine/threonine protein phosphatase PrpC